MFTRGNNTKSNKVRFGITLAPLLEKPKEEPDNNASIAYHIGLGLHGYP